MNDVHKMEQEKNVLRWGGLAGILGGILSLARGARVARAGTKKAHR